MYNSRDSHRSRSSTGRSEAGMRSVRSGHDHHYRSHGGQLRNNHLREEYQQRCSHRDAHRDRSRSPIRANIEGRRHVHWRRQSGKDNDYHKRHYNVQREISNPFEIWDDERLKYLAKKTDPIIVEILFNDQKGLFGTLSSESFLKDAHKLKLLIQILHNLCNTEDSEHMTSLLSQIVSKKYNLFIQNLACLLEVFPAYKQSKSGMKIMKF